MKHPKLPRSVETKIRDIKRRKRVKEKRKKIKSWERILEKRLDKGREVC